MMSSQEKKLWRMFCAVELPDTVKALFADHVRRLRDAAHDVRASWARPESVHITLKFVGEIEQTRARELSLAAERAIQGSEPFQLAIEGAGSFPPRGAPRVLWLGVRDDSGGLTRLQTRLEDECAASGFPNEPRVFHPHLTVARLKAPAGAKRLATLHKLAPFELEVFRVDRLKVIRSELGAGGSRYMIVSEHFFRGG
jgi:2'-5' RNA ligase